MNNVVGCNPTPDIENKSVKMSESKDPLPRMLSLLQIIPRYPRAASTSELQERLRDRGFRIDMRSLQRDLIKLSSYAPILCNKEERPYRWSCDKDALINFSAPDVPEALALCLAEKFLEDVLPQGVMYQLSARFRNAREYLERCAQNDLAHWPQRVRTLPNGKALRPAEIAPNVWADVSTALVEQKQIRVDYLSRSKGELKQFRLHPLSLVSRHSISYLIATVNEYDDPRQFALHRIKSVELLIEPVQHLEDFDLDTYIASGAFSFRQSAETVELIADVHPQIAWLLSETPLGDEQTLEPLPNSEWQRLRARVPMDQETLWWVFGLNENIRVYEPMTWVDEIKTKLENMVGSYE